MSKVALCQSASAIALGLLLVSCGPSDAEVVTAVRASLEQRVPSSLARFALGGGNAQIDQIRVVKTGTKQQGLFGQEYVPVVVHVKGTCAIAVGDVSLERRTFDADAEYYLTQDGYGEWQAASPMP